MPSYALTDRAYLRLSGSDATRFLSGQITQKVDDLSTAEVLWTAVTNAKGGIEGVGCVQKLEDGSFLIDCPSEIGDEMEARLDRYLIADDCEWTREDDRWMTEVTADYGEGELSKRFRKPMREVLHDLYAERPPGVSALPEELENQWCAQHAVPRWGREITAGRLPAEVGLHALALSFDKGCYIGQEIISRMEAAGKTRSKLYQLISAAPLPAGDYTTTVEVNGKHYGLIVAKEAPGPPPESGTVTAY